MRKTVIEISTKDLKHNFQTIRSVVGKNVLIAPVVKANAYGHGLTGVSQRLEKFGADWFCIHSIEEAITLIKNGTSKPILLISIAQKEEFENAIDNKIRLLIQDLDSAKVIARLAQKRKITIPVHIKLDTGMHRQGSTEKHALTIAKHIHKTPGINLEGISTHFASSDKLDNTTPLKKQIKKFTSATQKIKNLVNNPLILHCANSAATLLYPETHFDLVRTGKAIYGYYPNTNVEKECLKRKIILRPTLTFKTYISQVKEVTKGSNIGYDGTFQAPKHMTIATIPVGYFDGLDRKLSNRGSVLIHNNRAPVIGRVSMNITTIDITDIPDVTAGDEVTIIGRNGTEEIKTSEIATLLNTIGYEITSRLRESIPRTYT